MLGPRGQLAVEEHGHADLLADERGRGERLGAGRAAPLRRRARRPASRRARRRAGGRRRARAGRCARPRPRARPTRPAASSPWRAASVKHRAVVVGVDVQVEHARRPDRRLEPLEHGAVAPLADVGDGDQEAAARRARRPSARRRSRSPKKTSRTIRPSAHEDRLRELPRSAPTPPSAHARPSSPARRPTPPSGTISSATNSKSGKCSNRSPSSAEEARRPAPPRCPAARAGGDRARRRPRRGRGRRHGRAASRRR